MSKKYFGTDGIRGRVGEGLINPEFILKLGWAVGRILTNGHRKKVLIGKDTRLSGYMFEAALEAGLAAAGVDSRLVGPMPTPAISYLTQTLRASAGIVISASHNPYYDNGVKFFGPDGRKLSDELEKAIEAELEKPMQMVDPETLGKAFRIKDAPGRYIEYCKSRFPESMRLHGLKVVVDCANGATYHIAPSVFRELGAEVIDIAVSPDGFNINEHCGSMAPEVLVEAVLKHKANLGIAFDGDGDRVLLVDEKGQILDGDDILYIMAMDRLSQGQTIEGVVGTVMSNIGLELALKSHGVDFHRSPVGDRHVGEALKDLGWNLGGESSGHILCADQANTGDGIVSSLQVLAALIRSDKSLSVLHEPMKKFPQCCVNVKVSQHADFVLNTPLVLSAKTKAETILNGDGRVLLRASGTEPVIRVMVEGKSLPIVEEQAQNLAFAVESANKDSVS